MYDMIFLVFVNFIRFLIHDNLSSFIYMMFKEYYL